MDHKTIIIPMDNAEIKAFKRTCEKLETKVSPFIEQFMKEEIKKAGKTVSTKITFMERIKELLGMDNNTSTQTGLKVTVDKFVAKTFMELAGEGFISKIADFCKWVSAQIEKYKSLISNQTKSARGALKAIKEAQNLVGQKMKEDEIHNRHIANMFGVPYELAKF